MCATKADNTVQKARRLVVCCDGTGNEVKENQSNVLKFYRVLKDSPGQIAFYDTGVGTIGNSGAWASFKNKLSSVFGLITGYGLDDNILDAYRFLVEHYRNGDEIYLFGFSRGAYTVRALAGFINLIGILHPYQKHLAGYALTAYKQADIREDFRIAWRVQEVLETRRATIRFMGCWDTVGSVIIPRPDRLYIPSLEALPFTQENPCVKVFRQAIAIDEKRRMFRLLRWKDGQKFKTNPFVKDENADTQDCRQIWFAGVHSDIGGGYPEPESGSAKFPLAWMVDEARDNDIEFRETMVKRLVQGLNPSNVAKGSLRDYAKPSATAPLHDSMNWAWRILEYLPKRKLRHDNPEVSKKGGGYFPRCEPRYIPADAAIDQSVWDRVDAGEAADHYNPGNLPPRPPSQG